MGLFESKEKKAARFYALSLQHDRNELEYLQKAIALGSNPAKEGLAKYFFRYYPKDKQIQQQAKVLMEEAERAGVNIDHATFAQICEKCGDISKADEQWEKAMHGSLSAEAQLACGNFLMNWHGKEKDKLLSHNVNDIISDKEFKQRNDICNVKISELEKEIEEIKNEQIKANNMEEEIMKLEVLLEDEIKCPSDEVLFDLLDEIVVYSSDDKKSVKLKIYLKIGKEIEADYINPKSQHFHSPKAHD